MRELISNAENRRLFLLEYFIYGSPCVAVEDLKKNLKHVGQHLNCRY